MTWQTFKTTKALQKESDYIFACFDSNQFETWQVAKRANRLEKCNGIYSHVSVNDLLDGIHTAASCGSGTLQVVFRPAYNCKFCGADSFIEPNDQCAPPDYCHESDHGYT
jgi:hypothetical protein